MGALVSFPSEDGADPWTLNHFIQSAEHKHMMRSPAELHFVIFITKLFYYGAENLQLA